MPRQAKPGAPGAVCRVGHRDDPGRSDRGLGGTTPRRRPMGLSRSVAALTVV